MKNRIKIPESFYVGVVARMDQLPVAYMTPYGTDKSSQQRIKTINAYASNYHRGLSRIEPKVITNEPFVGFKIKQVSIYKSADMWKIEDPRGFVLDVSSDNVLELIDCCTIDRGEILEKCVWARVGPSNILLSTTSPEYQLAVSNTNAAKGKDTWRNVKIGNEGVFKYF